MSSKWQVHCGRESNLGNFYLYHPTAPDSGWTHFDTWEAAMREANRRANIIEVELPRVGCEAQVPTPADYVKESPIRVSPSEAIE